MWLVTKDGDKKALALFERHYSCRKDGARKIAQFVGPGEKLVIVHLNKELLEYDALFVWRKFKSDNNQQGINCAVFRNESKLLSSDLVLQAEKFAFKRWGKTRLYTYINTRKIISTNPGYCFLKAGWKKCGYTKVNKLLILEKYL